MLYAEGSRALASDRLLPRSKGNQFGFIECEATFALYGRDVCFHIRDTGSELFKSMSKGATVSFAINPESDAEKLRSCNITVLEGGSGSANPFVGVIRSKTEKYGFIQCAETYAIYGKDIFLMPSLCGGIYDSLMQDEEVTFDVEQDDKGIRAINVAVAVSSNHEGCRQSGMTSEGSF